MNGVPNHRVTPRIAAFDAALREGDERRAVDDFSGALYALERAHVLGQRDIGRHLRVHLRMLRVGWAARDAREVRGQLLRLALTPVGHLTGRLPAGNTGSTRVGPFVVMPVEGELARLMAYDN